MIINIFSAYYVPLLKDINHPRLLQEWKLDIDATAYERNIDANMYKPSDKNKLIVMIATCTGQPQLKNNSMVYFSHRYGTYCKYSKAKTRANFFIFKGIYYV